MVRLRIVSRVTICSKCEQPRAKSNSSYCLVHHAEKMRKWRKTHPLTPAQRVKDNARSYAGVYLRRGKIERKGCDDCGNPNAEMHHSDYGQPLLVEWKCRDCHLKLHSEVALAGSPSS